MTRQNGRLLRLVACALVTIAGASDALAEELFYGTDGGARVLAVDVGDLSVSEVVSAGDGGLDAAAGFALGPDGKLYVASADTDEVLRYTSDGSFFDVFIAGNMGLRQPMALAFGPDGDLYVSSRLTHLVRRYDGLTGASLGVFVGFKSGGLLVPDAMVFGPDGDLYVASSATNQVLRYDGNTGAFVEVFVTAADGGLDYPSGLLFTTAGELLVSSHGSDSVLRYDDASGAFLGELAGAASGLVAPVGLAEDSSGRIYAASFGSNEVLRYLADGTFDSVVVDAGAETVSFIRFIDRPSLASLSIAPSSLIGSCANATGTVTLNAPAPEGGAVVALQSLHSAASVPATVTVLSGATTASFTITTSATTSDTSGQIRATYNGINKYDSLMVRMIKLNDLTLSPTTVVGGNSSVGTVIIECAAPAAGVVVTLSDDSTFASVPATVTVTQGNTSATFSIDTTAPDPNPVTATITASAGRVVSKSLTIQPIGLQITNLTISNSQIIGSRVATGTVTLSGAAPAGGTTVALSSSQPGVASVPATVDVLEGNTSATFAVTTFAVTTTQSVTMTATLGFSTKDKTFTVIPIRPKRLQLDPAIVTGGSGSTGKVTLHEPAAPGDIVVTLTSANPAVAQVPASITIPFGTKQWTFPITTSPVGAPTGVLITATANGGSASATLTVNP